MKAWVIEAHSKWFVIKAKNKADATFAGRIEFGRALVEVRPATKYDIELYLHERKLNELEEV